MRRLLSIASVSLLIAAAAPALAAGPIATGALVVGDGASLTSVDPVTGARTVRGVATANVRDVAVDAQRRLLALTTDGSIERFDPGAYSEGDPTANREVVGALSGALGMAIDIDGTLLLADTDDDRIVRIDPDAFQAGAPETNQSLVSSGELLDGPLDVAIDAQLDVAYSTTTTMVVSIDLAADPGANQAQVANSFVWASLAVLPDGRIVAAGPFGLARLDPADTPPVSPSVVASGGELQQPTGLAVESGGTLVVPESSDGDVVRIFPDAFDPLDLPANQEIVAHFDAAPALRGIAVVPEPGAIGLQAVAVATLQQLVRRRSQRRAALV